MRQPTKKNKLRGRSHKKKKSVYTLKWNKMWPPRCWYIEPYKWIHWFPWRFENVHVQSTFFRQISLRCRRFLFIALLADWLSRARVHILVFFCTFCFYVYRWMLRRLFDICFSIVFFLVAILMSFSHIGKRNMPLLFFSKQNGFILIVFISVCWFSGVRNAHTLWSGIFRTNLGIISVRGHTLFAHFHFDRFLLKFVVFN